MLMFSWHKFYPFCFQTFKKTAKMKDESLAHISELELEQKCWDSFSEKNFNRLGEYAMDIQVSVFEALKIKRANLNQLNSRTLLERLQIPIPVSYKLYFQVTS